MLKNSTNLGLVNDVSTLYYGVDVSLSACVCVYNEPIS